MKINKWTLGLASIGLVSLTSAQAQQTQPQPVALGTALSATTVSGSVDTDARWNLGSGNANPAPFAFNSGKQDGFNLNSADVRIEKQVDVSVPWSAGYCVDLMYGPDAPAVTGNSLGNGLGENLRQAYVELSFPVGNYPTLKIGRWDTILGFESIDSYKNPNFTRSYGFTLEPTEHTGVLAHYKFTEFLAVDAGVADTVTTGPINSRATSVAGNAESRKAYLGLITLTAPDSFGFLAGDTVAVGAANGAGLADDNKTHLYAGANLNTPLKDLKLGVAYDAVWQTDVNGFDYGYATALAGYVTYNVTEKLHAAVRGDYARGAALGGLADAANGVDVANGGAPSDLHRLFSLTGTLSYDLWANVLTRLEVRWDHALDNTRPFGGTVAGAGEKKNEVMIAANLVYKF